MKRAPAAAAFALTLVACSDDPLTWGDVSAELSSIYCNGIVECGHQLSDELVSICIEHTAWHLCVPDGTCAVALAEADAVARLGDCRSAVSTLDQNGCFFLSWYGLMPDGCLAAYELKPEVL